VNVHETAKRLMILAVRGVRIGGRATTRRRSEHGYETK
jgi:hypothetical protein